MKSFKFFISVIVSICVVTFLFGCDTPDWRQWEDFVSMYKDVFGYEAFQRQRG